MAAFTHTHPQPKRPPPPDDGQLDIAALLAARARAAHSTQSSYSPTLSQFAPDSARSIRSSFTPSFADSDSVYSVRTMNPSTTGHRWSGLPGVPDLPGAFASDPDADADAGQSPISASGSTFFPSAHLVHPDVTRASLEGEVVTFGPVDDNDALSADVTRASLKNEVVTFGSIDADDNHHHHIPALSVPHSAPPSASFRLATSTPPDPSSSFLSHSPNPSPRDHQGPFSDRSHSSPNHHASAAAARLPPPRANTSPYPRTGADAHSRSRSRPSTAGSRSPSSSPSHASDLMHDPADADAAFAYADERVRLQGIREHRLSSFGPSLRKNGRAPWEEEGEDGWGGGGGGGDGDGDRDADSGGGGGGVLAAGAQTLADAEPPPSSSFPRSSKEKEREYQTHNLGARLGLAGLAHRARKVSGEASQRDKDKDNENNRSLDLDDREKTAGSAIFKVRKSLDKGLSRDRSPKAADAAAAVHSPHPPSPSHVFPPLPSSSSSAFSLSPPSSNAHAHAHAHPPAPAPSLAGVISSPSAASTSSFLAIDPHSAPSSSAFASSVANAAPAGGRTRNKSVSMSARHAGEPLLRGLGLLQPSNTASNASIDSDTSFGAVVSSLGRKGGKKLAARAAAAAAAATTTRTHRSGSASSAAASVDIGSSGDGHSHGHGKRPPRSSVDSASIVAGDPSARFTGTGHAPSSSSSSCSSPHTALPLPPMPDVYAHPSPRKPTRPLPPPVSASTAAASAPALTSAVVASVPPLTSAVAAVPPLTSPSTTTLATVSSVASAAGSGGAPGSASASPSSPASHTVAAEQVFRSLPTMAPRAALGVPSSPLHPPRQVPGVSAAGEAPAPPYAEGFATGSGLRLISLEEARARASSLSSSSSPGKTLKTRKSGLLKLFNKDKDRADDRHHPPLPPSSSSSSFSLAPPQTQHADAHSAPNTPSSASKQFDSPLAGPSSSSSASSEHVSAMSRSLSGSAEDHTTPVVKRTANKVGFAPLPPGGGGGGGTTSSSRATTRIGADGLPTLALRPVSMAFSSAFAGEFLSPDDDGMDNGGGGSGSEEERVTTTTDGQSQPASSISTPTADPSALFFGVGASSSPFGASSSPFGASSSPYTATHDVKPAKHRPPPLSASASSSSTIVSPWSPTQSQSSTSSVSVGGRTRSFGDAETDASSLQTSTTTPATPSFSPSLANFAGAQPPSAAAVTGKHALGLVVDTAKANARAGGMRSSTTSVGQVHLRAAQIESQIGLLVAELRSLQAANPEVFDGGGGGGGGSGGGGGGGLSPQAPVTPASIVSSTAGSLAVPHSPAASLMTFHSAASFSTVGGPSALAPGCCPACGAEEKYHNLSVARRPTTADASSSPSPSDSKLFPVGAAASASASPPSSPAGGVLDRPRVVPCSKADGRARFGAKVHR